LSFTTAPPTNTACAGADQHCNQTDANAESGFVIHKTLNENARHNQNHRHRSQLQSSTNLKFTL